jgi:hypothetical protein
MTLNQWFFKLHVFRPSEGRNDVVMVLYTRKIMSAQVRVPGCRLLTDYAGNEICWQKSLCRQFLFSWKFLSSLKICILYLFLYLVCQEWIVGTRSGILSADTVSKLRTFQHKTYSTQSFLPSVLAHFICLTITKRRPVFICYITAIWLCPLSTRHGAPSGCRWRQMWKAVCEYID